MFGLMAEGFLSFFAYLVQAGSKRSQHACSHGTFHKWRTAEAHLFPLRLVKKFQGCFCTQNGAPDIK